MARGPKRHLKRLFAPKEWMLSKLTGVFAPRPRAGPHKLRECMPLSVILRNRLKYSLNGRESQMILRQKLVNVDGRPRTDAKYPAGFQDVIEIPKTNEKFRMMYDHKGRFTLVNISDKVGEADIKLCKVQNVYTATGRVPVVVMHDGRRIRYPSLKIQRGDTCVVNIRTGKIQDTIKLRKDAMVMLVGGANRGRVGKAVNLERHPGGFGIAHVVDEAGNEFATRISNVFVLGKNKESVQIALPKLQGVKQNVIVERDEKLAARSEAARAKNKAAKAKKTKN
jgi:small subunit ribosomal protein S4e